MSPLAFYAIPNKAAAAGKKTKYLDDEFIEKEDDFDVEEREDLIDVDEITDENDRVEERNEGYCDNHQDSHNDKD